ncbi:hypothetical protein Q0Z83_058540 [Actinoplanes sichuanensis]|uniref:non-specific serine/threonine protein kinase n=1 Tax=Actinoplanes sichuanensis TaxID=512349 RepID=A0ABW4AP42_9ACTN|nr:protein kinase [Actinoplanes sichuanensis]BEL07663.1 hypothetical protein Q0Z83_058540 [Actinoplanes sichuanensis]
MPDAPVLLAGRYRLGESLGRGGMGQVLLARDETLQRDVAIKEIDQPFGADGGAAARRTLREARASARINHPNVVQVYDVLQLDDRTWIVMEYVPSRSLREEIAEQGPLDPYRVARIGLELLGALRTAHRLGVEHRDVKPANVLLADDGRVLLTDFGIAAVDDDGVISRSDILVGSPQFMAPERAQGNPSGPEADLWSLGATLYAAIEGRAPYQRGSTMATLAALATEEPDPPAHAGVLRPLLDGLLHKDPATRMTAEDAEGLARAIITGLSEPAETVEEKAKPSGLAGLAAVFRIPRPRASGERLPDGGASAAGSGRSAPASPLSGGRVEYADKYDNGSALEKGAVAAAGEVGVAAGAGPEAGEESADEARASGAPGAVEGAEVEASAGTKPQTSDTSGAGPGATPEAGENSGSAAGTGSKPGGESVAAAGAMPKSESVAVPGSESATVSESTTVPESESATVPESTVVPRSESVAVLESESATAPEPESAAAPEVEPVTKRDGDRGLRKVTGAPPLEAHRTEQATRATSAAVPNEATGTDRRRRGLIVAVAALAVVLVLGVAWALTGRPDNPETQPAASAAAPTGGLPAGGPATSTTPSSAASSAAQASPSPASPSPTPTGDERPPLPAGWVEYKDDTGFSLYVPAGWKRSKEGSIVYFRGDGKILGVDQTDEPKSNPVKDWRTQADNRVAGGDFPQYDEVHIKAVDYFLKAADWEFTFMRDGVRRHVNNRGTVVSKNRAYGIYWQTPDSEWSDSRDDLQLVFDSFVPDKN